MINDLVNLFCNDRLSYLLYCKRTKQATLFIVSIVYVTYHITVQGSHTQPIVWRIVS